MAKILTVLVNMQKLLTFFSKNITIYRYAIFNDQSFNDPLTNDTVSFEQLGSDKQVSKPVYYSFI